MKDLGCRFLGGDKLLRYGTPPTPWTPAPYRGTGHAFAGVTSREAGLTKWPAGLAMAGDEPQRHISLFRLLTGAGQFRPNRSCRLVPAHQGMKSRSCGLVQRISTAGSATPRPDPCGGQAPALHFLIPPSAIGLQFGTFRRWRAVIKVDWRAHPGSESGTCFRTNRSCWLAPAHQGVKKGSGVVCATHPAPSWGRAPALHFSLSTLDGSRPI